MGKRRRRMGGAIGHNEHEEQGDVVLEHTGRGNWVAG
jgi:hypothetical protein